MRDGQHDGPNERLQAERNDHKRRAHPPELRVEEQHKADDPEQRVCHRRAACATECGGAPAARQCADCGREYGEEHEHQESCPHAGRRAVQIVLWLVVPEVDGSVAARGSQVSVAPERHADDGISDAIWWTIKSPDAVNDRVQSGSWRITCRCLNCGREVEPPRHEPWIVHGRQHHAPVLVSFVCPHCKHDVEISE